MDKEYKLYKRGDLRGDKIRFPDGVGCCIWYPFDDTDEWTGVAFDFSAKDIHDLIDMLIEMRDAEPDEYQDD